MTATCGYGLIGRLCDEPRDNVWCAMHDQPGFSVCAHNGTHQANHLCPAPMEGGARCKAPLCSECVHATQGDGHQHIDEVPDLLKGSPRGPVAQRDRMTTEDLMNQQVAQTLVRLQEQGTLVLHEHADPEAVASIITHDLGILFLANLLMGKAVLAQ